MPLDGIVMHKLINQCNKEIINESIKNIYQPIENQVLFQLNKSFLLFSLENPSYFLILENKPEIPDTPSNFSLFLRKKIKNGRIISMKQLGLDRLGYLEIDSYDEVGNFRHYKLYFELMGRDSNLFLVNENGVIEDALKKGINKARTILGGAKYFPFYDDSKPLITNFSSITDLPQNLQGFSKKSFSFLNSYKNIDTVKSELENDFLYFFEDDKSYDLTGLQPSNIKYEKLKASETISKLFQIKANQSRVAKLRREEEKIVIKEIEKLERLKDNLERDIKDKDKLPALERNGELLQAYIYMLKRGMDSVTVNDWNTGEDVTIKIDPLKNPTTNLEMYFKNIKKIRTRVELSIVKLEKTNKELEYLYQLWSSIDNAEDIQTIQEIKEEMVEQNLVKKQSGNKKPKKIINPFRKYEFHGFEILVGKNNKQNDELTRNATKNDIWLHTQGIPGSHVIIKEAGRTVPEEVIKYAASLAAKFSRGKMSTSVAVDYTKRENVWKPKGAKPGMVLYEKFITVFVQPAE